MQAIISLHTKSPISGLSQGVSDICLEAFRPDPSLETSLLGRAFASTTLQDARKANATLAWAKSNRYDLRFRKGATSLTPFSDLAGPNESAIQGGRVFALTDDAGQESEKGVSINSYW
jgi:hypothetical protein